MAERARRAVCASLLQESFQGVAVALAWRECLPAFPESAVSFHRGQKPTLNLRTLMQNGNQANAASFSLSLKMSLPIFQHLFQLA